MPIQLQMFEKWLMRLNLLPTPLIDTPLATGIAKILVVACELGIFDQLAQQGLTGDELASKVECHPQGLQLILQPLVSAGYLRYRRGTYYNTRMAQRWLVSSSRYSIVPYILHSQDIVDIWDHIPTVIRTNQQVMATPYAGDADEQETQQLMARHYAGLASLARLPGREIVWQVHLPTGATRLLDVGGSHAVYSALFCRKYPDLQATIVDIQPGILAGKKTAKHMKLEGRMDFVCADILANDFSRFEPQSFDIALYFHIAHLFTPEINVQLLSKVVRTLKPGGILVFVDQVTDQTHRSRLASLMIQLMALTTTIIGGTCYPFSTVQNWLQSVGMEKVQSHRLLTPGATLITAQKSIQEQ